MHCQSAAGSGREKFCTLLFSAWHDFDFRRDPLFHLLFWTTVLIDYALVLTGTALSALIPYNVHRCTCFHRLARFWYREWLHCCTHCASSREVLSSLARHRLETEPQYKNIANYNCASYCLHFLFYLRILTSRPLSCLRTAKLRKLCPIAYTLAL